MKKFVTGMIMMISLISFFACSKKGAQDCPYVLVNVIAPDSELTQVQDYLALHTITATKAPSGFYYVIDNPGTGAVATALCSSITVKYKGKFTNDTVFDSTASSAVVFSLGQLIGGWQKGIPLIKAGGRIRLYIPPSLGYGKQGARDNTGKVIIPPDAILIYDIELEAVSN